MKSQLKTALKQKRRWRIRKKVSGTAERPRLAVHFSGKHVYAQCIDDEAGTTLAFISTLDKSLRDDQVKNNQEGVSKVARALAEKAKSAGISRVVFDRSGRLYHGRVKLFADAAREGGLEF
jgi:large subunit ribosomal protein L18